MNNFIERIDVPEHIALVVGNNIDALCAASALYTHLMRLHKKVSFVCIESFFPYKLSFIPWSDKLKAQLPSSVDSIVSFVEELEEFTIVQEEKVVVHAWQKDESFSYGMYDFFMQHAIELNQKMAMALCSGLLYSSDNLAKKWVDGTTFASLSKLIEAGASYGTCHENIASLLSLGAWRFKSYVIQNIEFHCDASIACVVVDKDILHAYGVDEDAFVYAIKETLYLPSVRAAFVLYEDSASVKKAYLIHKNESQLGRFFVDYEVKKFKEALCITFAEASREEILTNIIQSLEKGKLF